MFGKIYVFINKPLVLRQQHIVDLLVYVRVPSSHESRSLGEPLKKIICS